MRALTLGPIGGFSMGNQGMKNAFAFVSPAVAILVLAVSVFAHHGTNISYDQSKPIILKGVMTDFNYRNPHPQVFFDVTDESGNVTHWAGEIAPTRSEEHTSELQSLAYLVCRLLLEKKKKY